MRRSQQGLEASSRVGSELVVVGPFAKIRLEVTGTRTCERLVALSCCFIILVYIS